MSPLLVASYTLFSLFTFYQQLHVKNFRGASQGFSAALSLFALVSMLVGFAFLLYYGYKVSWLGALALLGISLLVKFVWFGIEAKLGIRWAATYISLAGFVGIPLCAFFM
jgi:hypothetical protein